MGGQRIFGSYRILPSIYPGLCYNSTKFDRLNYKDIAKHGTWNGECTIAFKTLKRCLCSGPALKSPDFTQPFILQTDASDRGAGAVHGPDGEEHPVVYYSRKFLPREGRYSTVEKECLLIKLAITAFHMYLLG